jgi:hypothetical protein
MTMNQLSKFPDWVGRFHSSWVWQHLLFPFLTSRLVLILIAWFARYFTANPTYAAYIQQGYFLTPNFLVDIWSRWDAQWYLSIVQQGYIPSADISTKYSNLAFFPLYPYLVRLLALPIPANATSNTIYFVVGLLVSNLCFLAAAYLLYKLVVEIFHDETIAQRTLILLIVFPAGFFFSTFYPESLFLFLSVAAVYAAWRKRWLLAAVLCSLAAVTRSQGSLLVIPLVWLYMDARQWKFRAIRPDILYFLIIPLFLGVHVVYLHSLTGDWLAMLHAENAWGRFGTNAHGDLIQQLSTVNRYVARIDIGIYLGFAAAAIYALFKFPSKAFGAYAIALLALPILSGNWDSLSRYLLSIFPVFIVLGWATHKREFYLLLLAFFIALQAIYFTGWTSYSFIA